MKQNFKRLLNEIIGYSTTVKSILAIALAIVTTIGSYFIYMDTRYITTEAFAEQVRLVDINSATLKQVATRLENKIDQDRYDSISDSILQLEIKYGLNCEFAPPAVKIVYNRLKNQLEKLKMKITKN